MTTELHSGQLYTEENLFAQGVMSGEFAFIAQDARRSDGLSLAASLEDQTRRTLENLDLALKTADMNREHIISLMVYLPDYSGARRVAEIVNTAFGEKNDKQPAKTFIKVAALEDGCSVRMDAIATSSGDREPILLTNLPFDSGSRCHGVRAGSFFFLSGVDAANDRGECLPTSTIRSQTAEVLARIQKVLEHQKLSLGDLCRTVVFMPNQNCRTGFGEVRGHVYTGIFSENEYPPNSGIYVGDLGANVLLRSVATAYRGPKTIVASPRVRNSPGSFAQAVRVGDWLLLAGQNAMGLGRRVEAENNLAGQTDAALRHTKDIVEEAGGILNDVVKVTVYLTAGQNRAEFVRAYREFFDCHAPGAKMPAGLTVEIGQLAPKCLVEVDAVAHLPGAR